MASLQLVVPASVVAGTELTVVVELTCDEPLSTTGIGLHVLGRDGVTGSVRAEGTYIDEHVALAPASTLSTGPHTFTAHLTIPVGATPSHRDGPTYSSLTATVVVVRPRPHDDLCASRAIEVVPARRPTARGPGVAEIVAAGSDAQPDAPAAELSRIGDPSIVLAFSGHAKREGWTYSSVGQLWPFGHVSPLSTARHHDVRYSLASTAGRRRAMVAVARFPRVGLRLDVTPSFLFRELFSEDIAVGVAGWDRQHRVTARSADQARPFVRAVVPALTALEHTGGLVRWTDDTIAFSRPSDEPRLELTARELTGVVEAVIEASKLIEPPTGELGVELGSWRALAGELHGRVVPGSLDIDTARVGRTPVAIFVDWDYLPVTVDVRVGPLADARVADDVIYDSDHEPPPQIAELVAACPAHTSGLRIAKGTAHARRPLHRAQDARELVDYLHRLLAAFEPHSGIYR